MDVFPDVFHGDVYHMSVLVCTNLDPCFYHQGLKGGVADVQNEYKTQAQTDASRLIDL